MLRKDLAAEDDGETWLIDSRSGIAKADAPEDAAWADWRGVKWSPKMLLGESMGASGGLQCVAAVEAVRKGLCRNAVVAIGGGNQQAAGMTIGG